MEITETTSPKEVLEKNIHEIQYIPIMSFKYSAGKPIDPEETSITHFTNLMRRKTDNLDEEYCEVYDLNYFINSPHGIADTKMQEDNSYNLSENCRKFVTDLKAELEMANIPFDQIQLTTKVNLNVKKEMVDKIKSSLGENATLDDVREVFRLIPRDNISNFVDIWIDGDCDETGIDGMSLNQYQKSINSIPQRDIQDDVIRSKVSIKCLGISAIKLRMMGTTVSIHGTVDFEKFVKSLAMHGVYISFGDIRVTGENVMEDCIAAFCDNGGSFTMRMTFDYGRKVNELMKKYAKK